MPLRWRDFGQAVAATLAAAVVAFVVGAIAVSPAWALAHLSLGVGLVWAVLSLGMTGLLYLQSGRQWIDRLNRDVSLTLSGPRWARRLRTALALVTDAAVHTAYWPNRLAVALLQPPPGGDRLADLRLAALRSRTTLPLLIAGAMLAQNLVAAVLLHRLPELAGTAAFRLHVQVGLAATLLWLANAMLNPIHREFRLLGGPGAAARRYALFVAFAFGSAVTLLHVHRSVFDLPGEGPVTVAIDLVTGAQFNPEIKALRGEALARLDALDPLGAARVVAARDPGVLASLAFFLLFTWAVASRVPGLVSAKGGFARDVAETELAAGTLVRAGRVEEAESTAKGLEPAHPLHAEIPLWRAVWAADFDAAAAATDRLLTLRRLKLGLVEPVAIGPRDRLFAVMGLVGELGRPELDVPFLVWLARRADLAPQDLAWGALNVGAAASPDEAAARLRYALALLGEGPPPAAGRADLMRRWIAAAEGTPPAPPAVCWLDMEDFVPALIESVMIRGAWSRFRATNTWRAAPPAWDAALGAPAPAPWPGGPEPPRGCAAGVGTLPFADLLMLYVVLRRFLALRPPSAVDPTGEMERTLEAAGTRLAVELRRVQGVTFEEFDQIFGGLEAVAG